MNKLTYWLCRAILLLEYIPSYRRFYVFEDGKFSPPKWRYCKPGRGMFGINFLSRFKLLWRYIDYCGNKEVESDDKWWDNQI